MRLIVRRRKFLMSFKIIFYVFMEIMKQGQLALDDMKKKSGMEELYIMNQIIREFFLLKVDKSMI